MLWTLLGLSCVLYTAVELVRAHEPSSPTRFGAVDVSTGRPLDVTLDRRTWGRRTNDR